MERIGSKQVSIESLKQMSDGSVNSATSPERQALADGRRRIARLFATFAAMYGQLWTSAHETDSGDVWLRGLYGINDEQIKKGIQTCHQIGRDRAKTGDTDYPPSLGQFRELCEAQGNRAHKVFLQALPRPSVKPETIARNIERMKQITRLSES